MKFSSGHQYLSKCIKNPSQNSAKKLNVSHLPLYNTKKLFIRKFACKNCCRHLYTCSCLHVLLLNRALNLFENDFCKFEPSEKIKDGTGKDPLLQVSSKCRSFPWLSLLLAESVMFELAYRD